MQYNFRKILIHNVYNYQVQTLKGQFELRENFLYEKFPNGVR